MKLNKEVLLFLLLVLCLKPSQGQKWPKVYLPHVGNYPYSVVECYDKGYLIGGCYISGDVFMNGLILKTDLNGAMIWNKTLSGHNDGTGVFDINQTDDNGLIISGVTNRTDRWGDPFIMKLNSCGEKEWCRIYTSAPNIFDYANSIYQIPGGYIAYIYRTGSSIANDHIFLYRLDKNGDILWQQQYALSDPLFLGAAGEHMMVTTDYHFLLTGYCYYPDSPLTTPPVLRPLIIKIDSTGNVEWELPWSRIGGESFHGESFRSIADNQQNIYSCGKHIEAPESHPTMIKTDSNGNELSYHDLLPNSFLACFFNINWFRDSTIVIDGRWIKNPGDECQIGVFKTDKNGVILDSVSMMQTSSYFSDAIVDHDNKLFLVQGQYIGNQWQLYAWKLNSDLEYDTIYTHPYVYDSLCPHPIVSDTIPLDCIIVGIDEPFKNPESGKLKVFPNPVRDILHIGIPEQLKSENHNPVFNLTTGHHQWHSAILEIYDLFGRRMFSEEVLQSEKEVAVDVAIWPGGMYVVRLVYNGQTVSNTKIIIEP